MKAFYAPILAALVLSSCISGRRPIVLDSTPAGAVIFVDGEDSGHSTPCVIQLPDSRRVLEFRLQGYEPAERSIRIGDRSEIVLWRESITDYRTWPFPFFLNTRDLLFPVKEDDGEMPSRIHVRLKRATQPLALAD